MAIRGRKEASKASKFGVWLLEQSSSGDLPPPQAPEARRDYCDYYYYCSYYYYYYYYYYYFYDYYY